MVQRHPELVPPVSPPSERPSPRPVILFIAALSDLSVLTERALQLILVFSILGQLEEDCDGTGGAVRHRSIEPGLLMDRNILSKLVL
ncbi:hypothetical protein JZ751_012509 [Albula glossodonta]|uniref:Uncharacterized protein n=1 Tax=Albula glossodonta TaxID=121402 RepID=A0A8T2NSX1_9TELE|nr:hypothetical protein JZ751_012509 [Albula glossodonta]